MGFVRCMGMSEDDIDEYLQPTVNLGTLPNQTKSYSYPSVSGKKGLKGIIFDTVKINNSTTPGNFTRNGTYDVPSGYAGYGTCVVNVDTTPSTEERTFTSNGVYYPTSGKYISKVTVDVSSGTPVDPDSVTASAHSSKVTSSKGSGTSESITCPGDGYILWHSYCSSNTTSKNGNARTRIQISRSGVIIYDAACRLNSTSDWPSDYTSDYGEKISEKIPDAIHRSVPVKKGDIVSVFSASADTNGVITVDIYANYCGNAS